MPGLWTGFPFWQTAPICAAGGTLDVRYTVPPRRVLWSMPGLGLLCFAGLCAFFYRRVPSRRSGSSPAPAAV